MKGPLTALRRLLAGVRRLVARTVSYVVSWAHGAAERVAARHTDRMHTDPSYPLAIVAGLTAGFGVLVGHPAVAAGVGLIAGELLGVRPTAPRATPTPRSTWRDTGYTGERLWDREEWDE